MVRVCVSAQTQQNQDRQACSTCRCVHVCTHTDTLSSALAAYQQELGCMLHLLPIIGCWGNCEIGSVSSMSVPLPLALRLLPFSFLYPPPPLRSMTLRMDAACISFNDEIRHFFPGGWVGVWVLSSILVHPFAGILSCIMKSKQNSAANTDTHARTHPPPPPHTHEETIRYIPNIKLIIN